MSRKTYLTLSFLLVLAFVLTACGAPATQPPAATEAASEPVTITWWHITTKDPGLSDWQKMADDYMAEHPNVKIEITGLENEAFKTKLNTVMQSGDPPDIFQSWGGGGFNQQVDAGLLKDITGDLEADPVWKSDFCTRRSGRQLLLRQNYGVPWELGWLVL